MPITLANSNDERVDVQALFSDVFTDIEPNAVPVVEHDYLYAPLVAQIRDEAGQVIAAAMTCRTQIAAGAVMANRNGLPDPFNITPLLDTHSELDLIAVDKKHRGQGLGSALIRYLENELANRNVRAWLGNVTVNLEAGRLRQFYRSHGFTVLPDFAPLPPLLGRNWVLPGPSPQFYFYKRPQPAGSPSARPRVPPPNPAASRLAQPPALERGQRQDRTPSGGLNPAREIRSDIRMASDS